MGYRIFQGVAYFSIALALSALAFLGWLGASGRLNAENRVFLGKLLRGERLKEEQVVAATVATTQPTADSNEQVTQNESASELANLLLDRRMKELSYQQDALAMLQGRIGKEREDLRMARINFLKEYEQTRHVQQDDGFKNQLKLFETMQPKQVKDLLVGMDEAMAAQYLMSMSKRTASKVVSEFRTPDEKARLQRLLERFSSQGAAMKTPQASPGGAGSPAGVAQKSSPAGKPSEG